MLNIWSSFKKRKKLFCSDTIHLVMNSKSKTLEIKVKAGEVHNKPSVTQRVYEVFSGVPLYTLEALLERPCIYDASNVPLWQKACSSAPDASTMATRKGLWVIWFDDHCITMDAPNEKALNGAIARGAIKLALVYELWVDNTQAIGWELYKLG